MHEVRAPAASSTAAGRRVGPNEGPCGNFVLVLHTHMPWLKHAGRWPVGEEWLFQAWGEAYVPVLDVLDSLSDGGAHDLVTLGLTPLIVQQMCDPGLLSRFYDWIGHAMLRCEMLTANAGQWPDTEARRAAASYWWQHYRTLRDSFDARDRKLVPSFRRLAENGVIEILGGPLSHAYLPLHDVKTVRAQLRLGLDAGEHTLGVRPQGIWLPECAWRPGLEDELAHCGVTHIVLDGPTVLAAVEKDGMGETPALRRAWHLGDSTVAAVGRDLNVSYRVWSPTGGYPGDGNYREYYRWESETGLKLWRVTDKTTPAERKELYDPDRIAETVAAHAADFRHTLHQSVTADGDVVVACYDTELFGHWWLEGPSWLESLLRQMSTDNVARAATLGRYLDDNGTAGSLSPPAGSWGLRKDFSIWDNDETSGMWQTLNELGARLHNVSTGSGCSSSPGELEEFEARLLAQATRELFLLQSSDWPFMIGHDRSVQYARERFSVHAEACAGCLDAIETLRDGSFDGKGATFRSWLTRLEDEHDLHVANHLPT